MSHTNYNGISTKPAKDETEAKTADPEKAPDVTPTPNVHLDDIEKTGEYIPETLNVPIPKQLVVGKVCNCTLLNVRENPSLNAKILLTIKNDSTVLVDPAESTDEWYKVIVNDQEGFCMKQFITLPQ